MFRPSRGHRSRGGTGFLPTSCAGRARLMSTRPAMWRTIFTRFSGGSASSISTMPKDRAPRRRGRCSARPLHMAISIVSGPTSTSTKSSMSATPRSGTSSLSAAAWLTEGWLAATCWTGSCRPLLVSTVAAIPNWTTTARWLPAPASWPGELARLAACSPMNTRTCGRWRLARDCPDQPLVSPRLGVGEQGDVRPACRGQGAVKKRKDQFCDITGCQAGTQLGIGLTQHLGIDGARADANGTDAVFLTLDRDRLGEADDSVLGDVVCGQPRELLGGVDAGERGDVDDPPFAGGEHSDERRATA